MNKFIKCNSPEGVLYIRASKVYAVSLPELPDTPTRVWIGPDDHHYFNVKESPEVVMKMIEESTDAILS